MTRDFSIRIADAVLAGTQAGRGSPVVFLHAGVADRRMWRDQMAMVAGRRMAVAYDRRGFGTTVAGQTEFAHVGDLLAVMDGLDLPRAVLVGASQGGRIAIDLALAAPDRVRALVLVAPAVSGAPRSDHHPGPIASLLDRLDRAEEAGDIDQVNAIEAHLWLDGPLSPEGRVRGPVRDLFLDMNGIANRNAFADASGPVHDPPSAWERLGDLSLPTLLIWGDLDFPDIQSRCRAIAAVLPAAKTAVIAGTAHLPNLEQPSTFEQYLLSFLDDLTVA